MVRWFLRLVEHKRAGAGAPAVGHPQGMPLRRGGLDRDDYHGHWFDLETGEQTERRSVSRDDFPVFSEVLDELDRIMGYAHPLE